MSNLNYILRGLWKENPLLVLLIGICPALAVSTYAVNGLTLGLSTALVLLCSNLLIVSIRNLIPDKAYPIVKLLVVSAFVSIVDLLLRITFSDIHSHLGIFVPLIVITVMLLSRTELVKSYRPVLPALFDALGLGLGFTLALVLISVIREFAAYGSVFGVFLLSEESHTFLLFSMPCGAFLLLGYLIALTSMFNKKRKAN